YDRHEAIGIPDEFFARQRVRPLERREDRRTAVSIQTVDKAVDRRELGGVIAGSRELNARGVARIGGERGEDDAFAALELREPRERAAPLCARQVLERLFQAGQALALHRAARVEQVDRSRRPAQLALIRRQDRVDYGEVVRKRELSDRVGWQRFRER